ncbi:hypothetical protein VB773_10405 [Haloarculaceae archaeon H-GB2-1]|nr:hypothetical protein [Haloarculaceae archaeon H-GB1-1]MEA5386419.1 hypothetical protein [Haloarculaceae archaeon H-GB11]MEA5407929.1 hypothetical protein [Haloarculaceae archaeon H-GB2-1]
MPCERALVRCDECGAYVTEEEWAKRGAPAAPIDTEEDGVRGFLGSLLLLGERVQFCSQSCKRRRQE